MKHFYTDSYNRPKLPWLFTVFNWLVKPVIHGINITFRCRRLPKALKEWDAYNELKQKIDDFNECCPLLELMANKAMKNRHWERMETLTKHHFDIENENFCLRNIMEAPLLQHKEDIEV